MQVILNTTKLTEIFIECDDFCVELKDYVQTQGLPNPNGEKKAKTRKMSHSEMMAIVIFYHYSGFKCFKWYYNIVIRVILKSYFPSAFSYNRFIQLMPELNFLLYIYLYANGMAAPGGGNYIDAKKLVVSHNRRIKDHKVFKDIAKRGKSSTGWFYGFKLHLIINNLGQIVLFKVTSGNKADNNHDLLNWFADHFNGFLYGDKGYISKIVAQLKGKGMYLITKLRKNMKEIALTPEQKYYLRFRGLIETVFDILKHIFDIEHSRHRSPKNFFTNVLSALVAYLFYPNKPSIPIYEQKITVSDINLVVFQEI